MHGKHKGDKFENDICRALSVWLVGSDYAGSLVQDLPFRRRFTTSTPLEGHWDGSGDILHRPDVAFPFCVECKKREGWELDGMFGNDKWPVWTWWEQAKEQAAKTKDRYPLLVFSRNRRSIYAMLHEEVGQCLKVGSERCLVQVERNGSERVVLVLLDDLAKTTRKSVESLLVSGRRTINVALT